MNDPLYHNLRETGWRRKLTPAEETQLRAWLAAHPEAQPEWEDEIRLNEVLDRLPALPVASNFTARVLKAVERENAAPSHHPAAGWKRVWRAVLPKAALAAAALGIGLFTYHQARAAKRMELAQSVAAVAEVRSLPSPEILQDFEAIRQLNPTPPPDEELLALLK